MGGGTNPYPEFLAGAKTVAGQAYTQMIIFNVQDAGYTRMKGKIKSDTYNVYYIIGGTSSYVLIPNAINNWVDFDLDLSSGTNVTFAVNNNSNSYQTYIHFLDLEFS